MKNDNEQVSNLIQSKNLMIKVADFYYNHSLSQQEIASILDISTSTVSRLLHQARSKKIVQITLDPVCLECITLEGKIREQYDLKEVIVAPLSENSIDERNIYGTDTVSLEAARFLQRIIKDGMTIGVSWGGTVATAISLLNPCQRSSTSFATLTGGFSSYTFLYETNELVTLMSRVFNGERHIITSDAYQLDDSAMKYTMCLENVKSVFSLYDKIDVSVCGVGSLYPKLDSGTARYNLLPNNYLPNLVEEHSPYGDIVCRFFDQNGHECDDYLRDHTVAIPFEKYKKIPMKIVVTSGYWKAETLKALLKGGLADVLIIDQLLARRLIETTDAIT